jgi:hypothetical protein
MDDDLAAVHGAVELGRRAWHQLPASLHLRLLHVLLNDLLSLGVMRGEVAARMDAIAQLQVGALGLAGARACCCCWS